MENAAAVVRIERLRELAPGGDAGVIELVELFLEQMREQLPRLLDAVERRAAEDLEMIAHRCAGSSATCGADGIIGPLAALERMAREGTLEGSPQLADAAVAEFARAETFLLGYAAGLRDRHRDG